MSTAAQDHTTEPRAQPAWGELMPRERRLFRGLVVPGLAAVTVAAAGLSIPVLSGDLRPDEHGSLATTGGSGVATSQPPGPVFVTYQPGQSSGWHRHPPAIHSMLVLTGTLSVYDEDCGFRRFGPGEGYVGGHEQHLVRNDGGEPLELVVTYTPPDVPEPELTVLMEAPPGCVT